MMDHEPPILLKTHCGGNVTVGSNPTPSAPTSEAHVRPAVTAPKRPTR
jgi:hypothetical protein